MLHGLLFLGLVAFERFVVLSLLGGQKLKPASPKPQRPGILGLKF